MDRTVKIEYLFVRCIRGPVWALFLYFTIRYSVRNLASARSYFADFTSNAFLHRRTSKAALQGYFRRQYFPELQESGC